MDTYDDQEHRPKRERPKQQEISQRTRAHARTLLARVYLAGDTVLLVRGEPDAQRLRAAFCQADPPAPPGGQGPASLGFANSHIVPLGRGGLSSRARSVQQWRVWIEKRLAGRTSTAELRELKAEWQELQSLGNRVAALHGLVGATATTGTSPYWLEPAVETALNDCISQRLAGLHVPSEVRDLARVVCWSVGLPQARRLIESLRGALPTAVAQHQTWLIKRFEAALIELQQLQTEFHEAVDRQTAGQTDQFYATLADNGQFQKLRDSFEAIPWEVRRENQIYLNAVDREIQFAELARMPNALQQPKNAGTQDETARLKLQKTNQAMQTFKAIVNSINYHLNSIKTENQRLKQATGVPFRELAREKGLFDQLRERFEALPEMVRSPERIFLPGRDRDIDLALTQKRVEKTLQDQPQAPSQNSLNWLALLCLTDNSTIVPHLKSLEKRCNWEYDINNFWQARTKPGYEAVLENLSNIHADWHLEIARRFLASGGAVDLIDWFEEMEISTWGVSLYGAAAEPFREVVQWLRAQDAALDKNEIQEFFEAINSEPGHALVESLARFLSWITRPTRQQTGEITNLLRTLSHPMLRRPLIDRLRSWALPPARSRLPAGCPANLPAEIAMEVRRLAFYQRMAGQPARIPGSIRDTLEARSRQATELEHILSLGPQATPAQLSRLENLSRRTSQAEGFDTRARQRMLRQIREVTVLTALTAAKEIVRNEIGRCWQSLLGFEADFKHLPWQEQLKLAAWIEKLDPPARQAVVQTLHAHHEHGPAYPQNLPQNQAWLQQARGRLNVEAWLAPPAMRLEIDGRPILLKPAGHPADIYLMGSRFGTCLNLGGGENRASVITNAADINKAVLYAWRADGTPIARRLVGIRIDWNMLGYRLYTQEASEALNQAFDTYCGTWAAKAGLGLASTGAPPSISGRFWYNDGAMDWTEQAYAAYREIQPGATFDSATPQASNAAQIQQALAMVNSNRPAAIAKLNDLAETCRWPAIFWLIRNGVELTRELFDRIGLTWSDTDFCSHLAAAGLVHKLPTPELFNITADQHASFWSDTIWTLPSIVPPERELIAKMYQFLMQLPANAESAGLDLCFATCRISPAFGILPFRKLVALLRRFSDFYVEPDCGCHARAWQSWAHALRMAWLREPDPAAFADALADPAPIVSQVMRLFCQISPDRRFATPIRRQLRHTTEQASQATLRELRGLVLSIAGDDADEHPETIAFDLEASFDDRLQAVVQLSARFEKPDAALGALLCAAWTRAELAQLPVKTRLAFAETMIRQELNEDWKNWPMIRWLATLPEPDQRALLARFQMGQTVLIFKDHSFFYSTIACVLPHALEDADESIRATAAMVLRLCVSCIPGTLDDLADQFGIWAWPEAAQKLIRELQDERKNGGDADSNEK